MSIKSDRWIRRMATSAGMIEPFSPDQVRVANGHKIVSYGTSSYGYDVRCADDFKIFTNINSTIVDPKSFDEKSFVDFKGPVCIIPPNSFALASTVEYFRIPRSVLTVCLGKCVTGDTRVVDAASGAYVPITAMRWGKTTLALDSGRLQAAKVSAFIPQGKKAVFALRTQAGLRIRATANHPFLTANGWVPLRDLRPGDAIAAARDIPVFGKTRIADWEASLLGLMVSQGQCDTPEHGPTDPAIIRLWQECMADSGMAVIASGTHGYRLVDEQSQGGVAERNRTHAWLQNHQLNVESAKRFVPQCVFTAPESSVRLFLQSLFSDGACVYGSKPAVFLEYAADSRRLIEDVHHLLLRFGVFSVIRENETGACKIQITDPDQLRRFAEKIGFTPGCLKQRRLNIDVQSMIEALPQQRNRLGALPQAGSLRSVAANIGGMTLSSHRVRGQSTAAPYAPATMASTGEVDGGAVVDGPIWDLVASIEPSGEEEVFDISVPTLHNFLANGLIVHNSTYARCFSGDTRVALADGTSPSLEEMARRHDSGESFWGYSIGQNGRLIVSSLHAPRFIGRDALLEVQLDNGERIHATPDHLFMRRDGSMTAAHALRPNDALMPLYRDLFRGQERVYQPIDGCLDPTHRLAAERTPPGFYNEVARAQRGSLDGYRRRPEVLSKVGGTPAYRNHKVAALRAIAGDHDVYCLTVPEAGNFALQGGVFVKNCGIIVNVTPLEPEWEGHVTLEFSNTTPLPAKIYANEGVAQMLFFESDEVCETSYRDRGGKYQGQRGVTLPKT